MSNTSNENKNKDYILGFDEIKKYAPAALIIAAVFIQYNMFATPADLNALYTKIMTDIKAEYATKSDTAFLKEQVSDMKTKIDKMYDRMIGGK